MIVGYVLAGLFAVNFLYVGVLYAIRHEGWFFIYNSNFGSHSNSELAFQILVSLVLIGIAWGIIALSRKRLRGASVK